jgi:hypothetical protein
MQKILVLILAILSSGLVFSVGYTADPVQSDSIREAASASKAAQVIKIPGSESTPGANCKCDADPDK